MPSTHLEPALYVVATPIGNLADITLRALKVLAEVDVIAAEDTRNSQHLLTHHGIAAKLLSLHQHNEASSAEKIISLLKQDKSIALITDAGTPAISDPGAKLIAKVREAGLKVTPLPGANAAIAALSASGIPDPHFLFYGFLPNKSAARKKELEALKDFPYTLIFYEAPHRILETVADLQLVFEPSRAIIFARELTKLFETIHTCTLHEAGAWLENDNNQQKGEFVLLIEGAAPQTQISVLAQRTLVLLLEELPLKQAVQLAAKISGESKNELYKLALLNRKEQ